MTPERAGTGVILVVGLVAGLVLVSTAGAVYDYLPDLLTPERDYEEVPWEYERVEGQHLAVHYRIPGSPSAARGVARVVDDDGNDLLHVYGSYSTFISDGYDEEGEIRFIRVPFGYWGGRADITLNGSTYVYHHDGSDPVEARLFKDATSGAFADPSTVLDSGRVAEILRERMYGPDAWFTSFRDDLDDLEGWDVHAPVGEVGVDNHRRSGHYRAQSRLFIDAGTELEDLTYIHRPAPGGAYVADASFRPYAGGDLAFPRGVPDHQAVLAGLSGPMEDPEVDWALVMAHGASNTPRGNSVFPDAAAIPGQYDHWGLYFIDSQGTRTQVAPTWCCLDERWHDVRAHVDPESGAVEVQVDGNTTALRFDDAFMETSDRIALGDIWRGDAGMWWTGGRMGYYDNLAVEPVAHGES